jgi:ribosomal-protein-alanine N-acetyltransferase
VTAVASARRIGGAPAAASDVASIRALEDLSPVTARLLEHELGAPGRCAVVARVRGEVVGYAAATCHLDETEILDVVVARPWRRQGIGARLVTELLAVAWTHGARAATLEVAEGNVAAQALYRHLGFSVEGRRPGYYPDGEAALIMWRRERDGGPDEIMRRSE